MSTADSIRGLVDQVASLEKSVMTVIFEATKNLAVLTNCKSFLMFESKGRRFYCGSEDICLLYASGALHPRGSDTKIDEGAVGETAWKLAEKGADEGDRNGELDGGELDVKDQEIATNGVKDLKATECAMEEHCEEPRVSVGDDERLEGENRGEHTEAPNQFKCHVCGKHGFGNAELKLHLRKYHKWAPFRCPKCHLTLGTRSGLKRHLACVHDIGRSKFLCQVCGFCTPRTDGMMTHARRLHADRPNAYVEVSFNDVERTNSKRGSLHSARKKSGIGQTRGWFGGGSGRRTFWVNGPCQGPEV